MSRSRKRVIDAVALLGIAAVAVAGAPPVALAVPKPAEIPVVTPTPQQIQDNGKAIHVPREVDVVTGADVDEPTIELIRATLTAAGAEQVDVGPEPAGGKLTVVVGSITDQGVEQALRDAGGEKPAELPAEGYSIAGTSRGAGGVVALAGNDGNGIYYAAQTFRQLARNGNIAAVRVTDHPLMALRGSIEGFYGAPWSHTDRLDQLAFYGDIKANTYIYTPKDDPYLREQWRDPHPAEQLGELKELVDQAARHHVQFTYAMSPGESICYSDPNDVKTLQNKLSTMYDQGARSFYVALDDIDYDEWNCAGDEAKYGAPGRASAGQAQADLLNTVQHEFVDTHEGAQPLQMVPTEYSDVEDSAYKKVLREQLDERVVVQWTGTDVVPPAISVEDADKAAAVWGRKVFVWDNYPVNDFGKTEGRLLMAPYDKREAGLHQALNGIVLNPMNQAAASKVALFGGASFAWNDQDYDPERTWREAAKYLAGGDPATTEALLAFFDVEHLAPTFGDEPWQPQAPLLKSKIDPVRAALSDGTDVGPALSGLEAYGTVLSGAAQQIRSGVGDPAFLAQTQPWLDALDLWSAALKSTVDGVRKAPGDGAGADAAFAEAAELAAKASEIHTIPGTTSPQGPVRVADGVLDTFVADAPALSGR